MSTPNSHSWRPGPASGLLVALALAGLGLGALALGACTDDGPDDPDGPEALVSDPALPGLVEVVPCKHSHEHELRHVQIFADPASAELFDDCVLGQNCTEPFPPGSLFVKREYEFEGCKEQDLVSYTANLKLEPGELPEGGDWRWQRLDRDLSVVEDGAPAICLLCHEDHCSPPHGHDLRCIPD